MKRILFAAAAFVMMAVQIVAQELKLPDEIRVVKLTSNDVNLRQEPSAKSARLIRSCGGEGPCVILWSAGTLNPMNSWHIGEEPMRAKYLRVLDRVKGDDGENWLQCLYSTDMIEFVRWNVYVMEKYTKPAQVKPLFADGRLLPGGNDNHYFADAVLKRTGEYKNWFVGVSWDVMENCGRLYIGRYMDGMLCVDYEVMFSNENAQLAGSDPLYVSNGTLYFDKTLYCADCYSTGGLDLHKLCANDHFLSRLMKICVIGQFEAPRVFCAIEGEDEWFVF